MTGDEVSDTRPSLFDANADERIWSPLSVGDKRLTWREAYDHLAERLRRADALAGVLADLDRCEHGRHEGDICTGVNGCDGPSEGNPHAQQGQVIGYGLAGKRRPIVMPPRADRNNAEAWYRFDGDAR